MVKTRRITEETPVIRKIIRVGRGNRRLQATEESALLLLSEKIPLTNDSPHRKVWE